MAALRHFTIPLFIPKLACPNRCIFCNQQKISGTLCQPTDEEVIHIIDRHLGSFPTSDKIVEVGFFGGNFTGIGQKLQERYLGLVKPYLMDGSVSAIRISTRPDYIDREGLELLKQNGVKTVELGAQSLDEEVLKLSRRGHTALQVHEATKLIHDAGLHPGLQMMIGLPGDTLEKSLKTAREFVAMGAENTRIYPTLVISDTVLEDLYHKGEYTPLSLEEAIEWVKKIIPVFTEGKVKILRIGLHPSEGLLNGTNLVAGPFHPAFGEMAYSAFWGDLEKSWISDEWLSSLKPGMNPSVLVMEVAPRQVNAAVGHHAINKTWLSRYFKKIKIQENSELSGFQFRMNVQ